MRKNHDKTGDFATVGFDKEIQVWYTKAKYDYIKFKLYVIFMYRVRSDRILLMSEY